MTLEHKAVTGFLAIVENGSFTKAAKKLDITPSALSIRISALENQLGKKLVIRGRPCQLTEAGGVLEIYALDYQKLNSSLATDLSVLKSSQ